MANKQIYEVPKVGRPTKMNKEILNKLEYAYSRGMTDEEACLFAGITKPTLYDYKDRNPNFKDKVEVLKSNVRMHAKFNIAQEIIDKKDVGTSKFILEKTSEEYKTKNVKLDGKVDTGAKIEFIDDIPEGKEIESVFGLVKEGD